MPSASTKQPDTKVHWTRSRARAAASQSSLPPQPSESAAPEDPKVKAIREGVLRDLGDKVLVSDPQWLQSLFLHVASESSVDEFLRLPSSGYVFNRSGRGRWAKVPRKPRSQQELCSPLASILSVIIANFASGSIHGASRKVIDNHAAGFKHPRYPLICPSISVVATGPSFEPPPTREEYVEGVGYSNVASVLGVMLDDNSCNDAKQASHSGIWSREVFMRQPNRNFFRSLLITQSRVRLLHYDRSGVHMSPFVNFHDDPHTFVRLVLGLSTLDEQVLGFDTSVQWSVDASSGLKTTGTVEVRDGNGVPVRYQMQSSEPSVVRRSICGRGTTCWRATHPETGEAVLIKDSWRVDTKRSEKEFMDVARGIEGVVQMVAFQDGLFETQQCRPQILEDAVFQNRIKSRVVMPRYGEHIDRFTSRIQAVGALRDALVGYYQLLKKSVLHRDISIPNILLGAFDAPAGSRGTLADFDMALWLHADLEEQMSEFPVGTQQFQSVALTSSYDFEISPPHDALDDLESFFWVYSHLVLGYDEPGMKSPRADALFAHFDDPVPRVVSAMKGAFVISCSHPLSKFWGAPCQRILGEFSAMIMSIHRQKNEIRAFFGPTPEEMLERFSKLSKTAPELFEKVIKLFDDALLEIEREDTGSASTSHRPAVEAAPPPGPTVAANPVPQVIGPHGSPLKRTTVEAKHDDAPPPKRARTKRQPKPSEVSEPRRSRRLARNK